MNTLNAIEQEHAVACGRVSILEKEYKENPSQSIFDELVEASADLICKGHEARIKQQMEMGGI